MHWFYDPQVTATSTSVVANELTHFKSLRLRAEEEIAITNGQGSVLFARCVDPALGTITPVSFEARQRQRLQVHLVQSLAKGGRDEAAVQAAVELGVSSITPLQASRSIVEWGQKAERNQERWQQIAISAMKQSQQAFLPIVNPLVKPKSLVADSQVLVLEPTAPVALKSLVLTEAVTIVVGPEGGFEQSELLEFEHKGFVQARLGSSVLRTSTAGPAALAVILAMAGAWD